MVEQLRAELAQVRREAAEERTALRQEAREQLAAVLTQVDAAADRTRERPLATGSQAGRVDEIPSGVPTNITRTGHMIG